MNKKDYLFDASGQLGQTLLTTLAGQLTYFYTEKAGLAAGIVATLIAVTKLISAVFDLVVGRLMEAKNDSSHRRYTSWLIRMAVPFAVCTVLLFCVPHNRQALSTGYVFITNLLVAMAGTAIAVPYAALQIAQTAKTEERGKIGIFRGLASYAGGILITLAVIPITNLMGGDQKAWISFAVIAALPAVLFLLICGKHAGGTSINTKEAIIAPKTIRFAEQFRLLAKNRYWWTILFVGIISQLLYGVNAVSTAYYCKWIFGNDNLMTLIGGFGVLGTALGFVIINPCVKCLGATKTMRLFLLLGVLSCALRMIFPYALAWNTVMMSLTNVALIALSCLLGVFMGMAVDHNEALCGDKMIAVSQSLSSMGNKLGAVVGGSITGWILGAVGYSAQMSSLTSAAAQGIFTISIYIPLGCYLLMFILMLSFNLEK